MKRAIPLLLTGVSGLFMIASFFVPHQSVSVPADFLQTSAIIVVACGFAVGAANLLRHHLAGIVERAPDWPYKLVLVVALVGTMAIGAVEGPGFLDPGTRSRWLYDQVYSPMSATMFALLAFFIASAAFRAFRIRTFEAGLLAAAALVVMVGRIPLGEWLTGALPETLRLHRIQEWIMDVPQGAARRAILIGAALGVMSTGLRVILGIERTHLGGED